VTYPKDIVKDQNKRIDIYRALLKRHMWKRTSSKVPPISADKNAVEYWVNPHTRDSIITFKDPISGNHHILEDALLIIRKREKEPQLF